MVTQFHYFCSISCQIKFLFLVKPTEIQIMHSNKHQAFILRLKHIFETLLLHTLICHWPKGFLCIFWIQKCLGFLPFSNHLIVIFISGFLLPVKVLALCLNPLALLFTLVVRIGCLLFVVPVFFTICPVLPRQTVRNVISNPLYV